MLDTIPIYLPYVAYVFVDLSTLTFCVFREHLSF